MNKLSSIALQLSNCCPHDSKSRVQLGPFIHTMSKIKILVTRRLCCWCVTFLTEIKVCSIQNGLRKGLLYAFFDTVYSKGWAQITFRSEMQFNYFMNESGSQLEKGKNQDLVI